MLQESFVSIAIVLLSFLLAWPVGKHMAKVYKGEKNLLHFMLPAEAFIFRLCRIDPNADMSWKQYAVSMLTLNLAWIIPAFAVLMCQGMLFLNPAGNGSMDWSLAFNSAVSFLTSTNLQHYSGETGATYLTQLAVFMFLQFASAAVSLSVGIAVVRGLHTRIHHSLGNFYKDFILSVTRILLPLCIIASVIFVFSGVPMTFGGPHRIETLQGDQSIIATGPVAAFLSIKELGSNGGGFFGANDAHPFENPGFFTFILHSMLVFLLPIAFIFSIGFYLKAKKFSYMVLGVMTAGFILITIPIIMQETGGHTATAAMGLPSAGNMEGKETRFGVFQSAFYCGENVCIPAGTIVSMHDSYMPLSGTFMLMAMSIDAFFGGLGTGWINLFIFLIVALFIASLMTGRTPEIFGKKIGIKEMKITVGVIVLQAMVPMLLTALACYIYIQADPQALQWLSNKGAHGFTTMFYEFISSSAGNGSGFEGLGDNTPFWNFSTSVAMLMGRFIPLLGTLYIAGSLAARTYTPRSSGTLRIQGLTFGIFLFAVIVVLTVLSLFPALMLGPLNEHFMLK